MRTRNRLCFSALAALAFLMAACAARSTAPPVAVTDYCDFGDVVFDGRFEGGRLSGCSQNGRRDFTLTIRPEAAPINPSPWYAFDVASSIKGPLTLRLDYLDYRHRYAPDIRRAGEVWRAYDGEVRLKKEGRIAILKIDPAADAPVRIAASALILPEETRDWMVGLVDGRKDIRLSTIGQSQEGRPIDALETDGGGDDWLLVIGRQHPPETTGAVALQSFAERLLADDPLANDFRTRVGLVIIPMLNPDGVVAGNWRFEASGVDLNRDWGPFEKPESRLIRDIMLSRQASGARLIAGLDFHSTRKDVLYTQPDSDIPFGWLPGAWHAAINARLAKQTPPQEPVERDASHNPDLPTFKTWIYTAHDVPGLTVEFGDETPTARLDLIGRIAAEELMRTLLAAETGRAPAGDWADSP